MLENKTRKELVEMLVNDQIKRGIVKEENKQYVINRILKDNLGTYASKEYLINLLKK